jgi:hypothetical protein
LADIESRDPRTPEPMVRSQLQSRPVSPGVCSRVLLVLVMLCGPASLVAQDGFIRLGPDMPTSTRAMALGGAYVMAGEQPDAVFQHPELLRRSTGMSLDVQRWGDAAAATSASAATSWFGGDVGVAIGLQFLQHTQAPVAGLEGPFAQDPLFRSGGVHVSERIASVGMARALGDVEWGLALRLVEVREGDAGKDTDVALTFGASKDVGPVTVGVAYRDVLRSVSDLTIGVGGYGWQLGFLDVGVSARLEGFDDDVRYGGGVELGYWPIRGRTFVARVGAQNVPQASMARPITLGFAYWGDALVLEWGFQPFEGMPEEGTHRFSIGWR